MVAGTTAGSVSDGRKDNKVPNFHNVLMIFASIFGPRLLMHAKSCSGLFSLRRERVVLEHVLPIVPTQLILSSQTAYGLWYRHDKERGMLLPVPGPLQWLMRSDNEGHLQKMDVRAFLHFATGAVTWALIINCAVPRPIPQSRPPSGVASRPPWGLFWLEVRCL